MAQRDCIKSIVWGDSGFFDTMLGWYAGVNVTTGLQNTAVGYRAGDSLTTGHNNVL